MDFIKKNKVLFIVLIIALVISGVLLFFALGKHGEMQESRDEIDNLRNSISDLIKEKPAPVKKNLDNINKDKELYEIKLKQLQYIFGKPYRLALQNFAKELDMKEFELREKFSKHWNKKIKKNPEPEAVLDGFFEKMDAEKVREAKTVFAKFAQEETSEKIDGSNINDILLESLGFPRRMTAIFCKDFIRIMKKQLADYLDHSAKDGSTKKVAVEDGITEFTFSEYKDVMPREDNIPYIIKQWRLIEDLVVRIKEAELGKIESLRRDNDLFGDEKGDYLTFTYSLKLVGSLDSVRNFINILQEAYKNNRVYVVN